MGVLRVWYPALVGIKAGTNVLVAGGTGIVGSGTVISLLKQGAKVLVATRSLDKFCVLHDVVPDDIKPNLTVVEGDLSTYDGVMRVFKKASTGEQSVNHVVASIGNYWQKGWLTEQTLAEFHKSQRTVVSHFLMMRTFLPYLNLREAPVARTNTPSAIICLKREEEKSALPPPRGRTPLRGELDSGSPGQSISITTSYHSMVNNICSASWFGRELVNSKPRR